jgi:uncharacterized membrane protein
MKISFTKFPIDISLCFLWSVTILPIAFYPMNNIIRTFLGLPFLIFIPGYILVFALFPTKKINRGINNIERIALSFGLSVTIVPFIGFLLNFTPWGIRLQSILFSLFFFNIFICFIAFYRWYSTPSEKRIIFSFEVSFLKSKSKLEKVLILFLGISIIFAFSTLFYVISNPLPGETFTEFYILGPREKIAGYPSNLSIGENGSIIIGLVNHEYRAINYTIEIWLVNETTFYNRTEQKNETIYTHMWFMNKITKPLNNTPLTNDKEWESQWEYNYNFQIQRRGEYKLTFLLYTTPTPNYNQYEDYKDIAKQKIDYAYERTYLQIIVT